jgi:hypothetical protein
MKHNGTKRGSNEAFDAEAPASHDPDGGSMQDSFSSFARIDALAAASLSIESLARYHAYKHALLELEHDDQSVISTLSIFVWDLFEDRSAREIH